MRDLGTGALSSVQPGQRAAWDGQGLGDLDPSLRRTQGSVTSSFILQELLKHDMNVYGQTTKHT
jgi:hypothetical protein